MFMSLWDRCAELECFSIVGGCVAGSAVYETIFGDYSCELYSSITSASFTVGNNQDAAFDVGTECGANSGAGEPPSHLCMFLKT